MHIMLLCIIIYSEPKPFIVDLFVLIKYLYLYLYLNYQIAVTKYNTTVG
jgi:hypothetical protein